MRQKSILGFFLGAAVLGLSACGDGNGSGNCDQYRNGYDQYGYNDRYDDDRRYDDRYGYTDGNYQNNYQNIPERCLPRLTNTDYRIPTGPTSTYNPEAMIVQQLQNSWGNIKVNKTVIIATTGVASIDTLQAGLYTWAQIRDRAKAIAEKCGCLVSGLPSSGSSLSIFGRIDFGGLEAMFAFASMSDAEVSFPSRPWYWGPAEIQTVDQVFSTLLQSLHQGWGYSWQSWGYTQFYVPNVQYWYVPYVPQTNIGVSVVYSDGYLSIGGGFSRWF
jgi:hypothetical protein